VIGHSFRGFMAHFLEFAKAKLGRAASQMEAAAVGRLQFMHLASTHTRHGNAALESTRAAFACRRKLHS